MKSPSAEERAWEIVNRHAVMNKEQWAKEIAQALLEAERKGMERAADFLEIKQADLLLMCGEMTAQEMRTVRAVLKNRAEVIRSQAAGERNGA